MNRKTRADSVLGNLSPARQEEIAAHAHTHTLVETVAWLRADGLKLSIGSLSDWLSDWRLKQIFRQSETKSEQFRDWLAKAQPDLSETELDRRAALMFQFAAVESGDAKTWLAIASARTRARQEDKRIAQRDQALKLEIEKYKLLAAEKMLDESLAEEAARIRHSKLSNAAKIQAMRKAAFADVDALEASGEIKLSQ